MKSTGKFLAAASVLALGLAMVNGVQAQEKAEEAKEKCGGIALEGKNDCHTAAHSCAGQAKTDNDPKEWVFTAKGECEKKGGKVIN